MKAIINVKKEVNFTQLKCSIGARYWEDTTVNGIEDTNGDLIPLRKGNYWCPVIDIETGIIQNWEKGKTAFVHYKCADNGEYWLIADDGFELKYPRYYVPAILDLTGEGYGDYVIMHIDENGKIQNWNNNPNIDDFLDKDEK